MISPEIQIWITKIISLEINFLNPRKSFDLSSKRQRIAKKNFSASVLSRLCLPREFSGLWLRQEFGSHSFCPRALFLPAPCQYFSINASEQMSIFLLLNLYLLLASISGNVQERGTYLWWYELHIENNGFHDYHAHPSDTIYVHSRISEGVQSSELRFWQNRTQSWLHVYCSTWLHYISQLLGWWNIV